MPARFAPLLTFIAGGAVLLSCAAPASAQRWGGGMGGWGGGWGPDRGEGWGGLDDRGSLAGPDRSREGKITAARFVSNDPLAAGLGHGAIAVSTAPGSLELGQSEALFAAAIGERLTHAGYAIAPGDAGPGQIAELTVTRTELEPQGPPHKKVSGEAEMGVGNRGSGFGLGIAVDLRKPLPPLIDTRLQVRIRDRATNTVLWEGRADVATRPGTKGWNDQQMAARLAAALLEGFPHASDAVAARKG